VADHAAVGIVGGGGDGDPTGSARHAPHAAGEGGDTHGVVGLHVTVIRAGGVEAECARSGVLGDCQRLAVDADYSSAGEMGRVGGDGVADHATVGVVGCGVNGNPVGAARYSPGAPGKSGNANGIVGQHVTVIRGG